MHRTLQENLMLSESNPDAAPGFDSLVMINGAILKAKRRALFAQKCMIW
jgi:hypothetical protein